MLPGDSPPRIRTATAAVCRLTSAMIEPPWLRIGSIVVNMVRPQDLDVEKTANALLDVIRDAARSPRIVQGTVLAPFRRRVFD